MITKTDQEIIKNELWARGEPIHVLHAEQRELLGVIKKNTSFLTVINCARQFGKTYFAVVLAFMHCLQRKSVVKYGAAYYTDLEKFIFPTIKKIVELMPSELKPEVIESKKIVKFRNGSVLDIVGLDLKPDGLRGNSVSLVLIEEAGYVKRLRYIYFDVVVPMFIHTQKNNPKCIMLGTPSGDLTHDFTNFFFPKAQREKVYFHKTIDDNPLLSESERQRIKDEYLADITTDEERRIQQAKMDRELYGKVSKDLERTIIPEWKDEYEYADDFRDEYFQFYHKYTAMDYGVADKTVFLFYYYDFKRATVFFEGEFVDSGSSMTTDALYEGVSSKEIKLYDGKIYRRVADTTNLLLINDFTVKYKMPFAHVKKDLLHVMVNDARMWVKSGRVRVSYMCQELLGCLRSGLWNDDKTAFGDSDLFGHYDALAAFVYAMRIIDQQTNPIPVTYGLGKDAIVVKKPVTDLSQKFKQVFNRKN